LDKLCSLKRELDYLEQKGLDITIVRNLREVIMEAEQGHHLASAMISSRVIRYVIDRIPGKTDEEKIKYLTGRGVVPKDQKDKQRQVMSVMRLSRNFLSHRIDLFPDSGNVLILIGGAFNLAKIVLLLSKKGQLKT